MTVEAAKIHKPLREMLAGISFEGRIHSVFKHTANISITTTEGDDFIISILAKTDEVFPWSVIIEAQSIDAMGFTAGERVVLNKESIVLSGAVINLSSAVNYETRLLDFINNCSFKKNAVYVQALLNKCKNLAKAENVFETKANEFLQEKLAQAKAALSLGELDAFLLNLTSIIGLGQGLTPSGDDYLTALISLIKMPCSPLGKLEYICPVIMLEAKEKTNVLSASYLNRAAMGQVRQKLSDFILAFMSGENIETAALDLLSIGSSSGKDLMLGVLYGFELVEII